MEQLSNIKSELVIDTIIQKEINGKFYTIIKSNFTDKDFSTQTENIEELFKDVEEHLSYYFS